MILKLTNIVKGCLLLALLHSCGSSGLTKEEAARHQVAETGSALREAFKSGDLETIKMYHHPQVTKALSYTNLQKGREEVLRGLKETMANYELEFLDERAKEKFIYQGDLVIQQMRFALRLVPKNGDDPFVFRGRTLLVLQRYDESPTGWATLHEIIQPFEE
ncbi:MAG: hypothetical protein Mars2KO_35070 [Maribacter sp.]